MNLENKNPNNDYIKKDIYGFKFDIDFNKDEEAVLKRTLFTDKLKSKKAYKEYRKLVSTITFKDHRFQSDPISINFMSAVLNLANLKFNQAVAKGMAPADAYETVYGETIAWKDAKNQWVEIRLDEVGQGLELALQKLKTILEKYS